MIPQTDVAHRIRRRDRRHGTEVIRHEDAWRVVGRHLGIRAVRRNVRLPGHLVRCERHRADDRQLHALAFRENRRPVRGEDGRLDLVGIAADASGREFELGYPERRPSSGGGLDLGARLEAVRARRGESRQCLPGHGGRVACFAERSRSGRIRIGTGARRVCGCRIRERESDLDEGGGDDSRLVDLLDLHRCGNFERLGRFVHLPFFGRIARSQHDLLDLDPEGLRAARAPRGFERDVIRRVSRVDQLRHQRSAGAVRRSVPGERFVRAVRFLRVRQLALEQRVVRVRGTGDAQLHRLLGQGANLVSDIQ